MKNLDDQFNIDIDGLVHKMVTNFELGAFTLPQVVQIYRIQTPFDYQQTIYKLTSDSQYYCPALLKQFNIDRHSFSSLFINYQDGQFIKLFQKEYSKQNMFIKVINHSFEQDGFGPEHSNSLKRIEPVIETIYVDFDRIGRISPQLQNDIELMNQQSKPFIIFVTFGKEYDKFQFNQRRLKQEIDDRQQSIGIDANTLSAYLISIMLLIILLIAGCAILAIQSPTKFSKTQFIVGKEN